MEHIIKPIERKCDSEILFDHPEVAVL